MTLTQLDGVRPSPETLAAVLAPATTVTRRVDVYEADGTTLWLPDAPLVDGSVSVDSTRDERRNIDATFYNENGALDRFPGGFWYDKVLKIFYGVTFDTFAWEKQIGEYLMDSIETNDHDHTTKVKGRDYTKKLVEDSFPQSTTFSQGYVLETVIRAIAVNGGITKLSLPTTGQVLNLDYTFEAGTTRWKAMTDLATAFGYELFFDAFGVLIMRLFLDPGSSPVTAVLKTGEPDGNLVKWTTVADQTRLYNAVEVIGQGSSTLPVFAMAENHDPGSPTSIENLGRRRPYRFTSSFMDQVVQCQALADSLLKVYGLESFVLTIDSIVLFWLEASEIIQFLDPDPMPGDPDRYLLSDFTIPLALGAMTSNARRVQVVA